MFRESEATLGGILNMMTPSDRSEKEASMKLQEVSHGDFKGYRFPMNPLNGRTEVRMTNGKFRIDASLWLVSKNHPTDTVVHSVEALVQPDDIAKIIGTIEIEKEH